MHHARHRQIHAMGAAIVERVRDALRGECRLQNRTSFLSSSGGSTTGNALAWPRGKTRILFRLELGLRLKESAHGQGFGREVVAALVKWGHATLGKERFIYPVAVQNTARRRIAENLHGEIIDNRTNPKYDSVVYRIPFYESPYSS